MTNAYSSPEFTPYTEHEEDVNMDRTYEGDLATDFAPEEAQPPSPEDAAIDHLSRYEFIRYTNALEDLEKFGPEENEEALALIAQTQALIAARQTEAQDLAHVPPTYEPAFDANGIASLDDMPYAKREAFLQETFGNASEHYQELALRDIYTKMSEQDDNYPPLCAVEQEELERYKETLQIAISKEYGEDVSHGFHPEEPQPDQHIPALNVKEVQDYAAHHQAQEKDSYGLSENETYELQNLKSFARSMGLNAEGQQRMEALRQKAHDAYDQEVTWHARDCISR